MKTVKKAPIVLIIICLLTCVLPVSASANAPSPADHFRIYITNLPEGAVYADLLIVFPENDPNYVEFQPSAYGDDPEAVKEIADYCVDGYQSFTLHYKNAKSDIEIASVSRFYHAVEFCNGAKYQEYLDQFEDLRNNYRNVKVALLDHDFKILSVSESVKLPRESVFTLYNGHIDYNAAVNTLSVETALNSWFWFIVIILAVGILVSVGFELLVALLFGLKGKKLLTILIVNLCTQVVMRALQLFLPLHYWIEVVVLEVLVYTAEFLIYKKRMKDEPTGKLLVYTIFANTVSLLLGFVLILG